MTKHLSRSGIALALGAAITVVACSKKPETAPTPATNPATTAPAGTAIAAPTTAADSAARATAVRDSLARAAATREAAIRKMRDDSVAAVRALANKTAAEIKQMMLATVYFDYDKADVRDDTHAALELKLPILTANRALRVRIAGHTDERGSDEYNLALGQRRADAAKKYFVNLGLDASRVIAISNGKEKPRDPGHDERAWLQNRRDDLLPFNNTVGQLIR